MKPRENRETAATKTELLLSCAAGTSSSTARLKSRKVLYFVELNLVLAERTPRNFGFSYRKKETSNARTMHREIHG